MTRSGHRWAVGVAVVGTWLVTAAPAHGWPRSEVDGGVADRTVEQVLRDPAFSTARPSWLARLRDDIRQWFFERLATLFESGAGTVLAWSLVALAVVVGVLVTVRALRGVRRGAVADQATAVTITRRPAGDWVADARAARDAGDLAEAVRCGYRAVVAGFAASEALDEVPGRTVGEYRAQVRDNRPQRLEEFTRASDVFERVWYARRPAGPDDVDAVLEVAAGAATARGRARSEVTS